MCSANELRLVPDKKPKWTQERLNHFYRYWNHYTKDEKPSQAEWNKNLDCPMPTEGEFQLLRIELSNGQKHIGDITIQRPKVAESGLAREIDISVFNDHQGKSYSKIALGLFLKGWKQYEEKGYTLEACVLNHSARQKVIHILEENGFEVVEGKPESEMVILHYKS